MFAPYRSGRLSPKELAAIGDIVVTCGQIEELMKLLPLMLLGEHRKDAEALTAHMSFSSVADSAEAMLDLPPAGPSIIVRAQGVGN
jgi:hypothetical protein